MNINNCLLRSLNQDLCSPMNPLYIGLQGHNGKGGRVGASETPEEYQGVLISDSPARQDQSEIYSHLDYYVKSFEKQFEDIQEELRQEGKSENHIRIKSLYLWSRAPGTGKTTTAVALSNEYLLRHYIGSLMRGQSPSQRPTYFLDVNKLQTKYNEFNRPRVPADIAETAARSYYSMLNRAQNTEFVVFDDIGVRDATDGFRGDLHSCVDHRVTNRKPTVYTSNIAISELPTVFGEQRLADRIKDMTLEMKFVGVSKRGRRT